MDDDIHVLAVLAEVAGLVRAARGDEQVDGRPGRARPLDAVRTTHLLNLVRLK